MLIPNLPPSSTGLPWPCLQPGSSGSILLLALHSLGASGNTCSLCCIVTMCLQVSPLPAEVSFMSEPPCNPFRGPGHRGPNPDSTLPCREPLCPPWGPQTRPHCLGATVAPFLGSWILSDMSYWVVADKSSHKLLLSSCLWILPAHAWPQKELRYRARPQAQQRAPCHSRLTCQVSWALPELQSLLLLETSGAASTVYLGLGKSIAAQSLTSRCRLRGCRARSGSCCIRVAAVGCRGYGGGRLGPHLRCVHH